MNIEEMKALVGQEVGVSSWIEVGQDRINAFADVTGDHQFIHLDAERARTETPFGGTIAHGYLTLSLLSVMAGEALPPLDGTRMTVNYGLNRVRFLSPVPSGARVRGHFVLQEMDASDPGQTDFIWSITVEIEGQEKPALVAEWITRRYMEDKA